MRTYIIGLLGVAGIGTFIAWTSPTLSLPHTLPSATQAPQEVIQKPTLDFEVLPSRVLQGLPVLVRTPYTGEDVTMTLDGKKLDTFIYDGNVSALIGIDLDARPGTSTVRVSSGNTSAERAVVVESRKKITAPLGIPPKLGGNTPASAQQLVTTLSQENEILRSLTSLSHALWVEDFDYPLENPVVTDDYGYTRSTVGQEISHKGTDFRAAEGTLVYAMNRGEVRLVREFRNYGNTVVIDHGLGLMTFYMHLSETSVQEGAIIEKGALLGAAGKTGYAEVPHLHITLRINNTSIDPIAFLNLF